MTITKKILKQRGKRSKLSHLRHLDLSKLGLGKLNNIDQCPRLESVDLRWNCLEEIDNFNLFRNLWWLDLSFNQIKCLASFAQLHSLGLLNLSHNLLTWKDLLHLADLHILDLRLHGNQQLESDVYYRMHVVDCLPNVWMFDGRLVTTTERQQIEHFFDESALTFKPVRHYQNKNIYRNFTSNLSRATVYGEHAEKSSNYFSVNEKHTAETDVRRLHYLAENFDLRLALNRTENPPGNCLRKIISNRKLDKQNCSVLLLLLVSSIEFNLPHDLLHQAFQICQMENQFCSEITSLLKLSRKMQIEVVCLLVSACKLDRDVLQGSAAERVLTEDGLYDRLYLALYHSVDRFLRQSKEKEPEIIGKYRAFQRSVFIDSPSSRRISSSKLINKHGGNIHEMNKEWKAHRNLIASEIVLLLSIVPQFYQCVTEKHRGVCKLLKVATGDGSIAERLSVISNDLQNKGGDVETLYKEVSEGIRHHIEIAVNNTIKQQEKTPVKSQQHGTVPVNTKKARFILGASQSYQKRPKSAAIISGERLLVSKGSNRANSVGVKSREIRSLKRLKIGDQILLGVQNIGKVLAVPDMDTALVQLDHVPDKVGCLPLREDNSDLYHCYVDVNLLEYDWDQLLWRPIDVYQSQYDVPNNISTGIEKLDNLLEYHSTTSSQIVLASQSGIPGPAPSNCSVVSSAFEQYLTSLIYYAPKPADGEIEFEMPLSSHFCNKKNLSLSKSMEKLTKVNEYSEVEETNNNAGGGGEAPMPATFVTECPVDPPPNEGDMNHENSSVPIRSEERPDQGVPKQNIVQKKIRFPNFESAEDPAFEEEDLRRDLLMKVALKTEGKSKEENADFRRAKSATPTRATCDTKFHGRPISARVTKKQVSFFNEGFYEDETGVASSFQLRRTEAWRSSASSFSDSQNTKKVVLFQPKASAVTENKATISNNVATSIILRENTSPSTTTISIPSSGGKNSTRQLQPNVAVIQEKKVKPLSTDVKKPPTRKWLAEGRDLHHEKEIWKRNQLITSTHDIQGTSCLPKSNRRSSAIKRKQATKSSGVGSFVYNKPNILAFQPVLKGTFPILQHRTPANPPSNLTSTLMKLHIKPNPLGSKQSAKLLRF